LRALPGQTAMVVLLGTWLAAACAAAVLAWARSGGQRLGRRERGLLLTLVLVLLAMTWPAQPLWEVIPVLSDMQFPWRYMEAASLLAAAAAVMAARARPMLVWPLMAVAIFFAIGQAIVPLADHILSERLWVGKRGRLPQFAPSSAERMAIEEQAHDLDPPEYVPLGAYAAGWRADRDLHAVPTMRSARVALKAPAVLAGDARVAITPRPTSAPGSLLQLDAEVSSPEGAVVRVPQLAWPALRAEGGGELEADPATGLSLLRLPPGHTETRLVIAATKPEMLGKALSLAGCVVWLVGLAWAVGAAAARRRARGLGPCV